MRWPTAQLSPGIADVVRGVTYSQGDAAQESRDGFLPVLRAGNIGQRLETERDLVWIPEHFVSDRQRMRKDDIVMCTSSGSALVVGKTAIAEADFDGSWGAFNAVLRPTSAVVPKFLYYWLQSGDFKTWRDRQAKGANIQNIRHSDLSNLAVPLPAKSEQSRIVELLDEADHLRRLRREADAKAARILPALFLKMFGDPATNPMRWPKEPIGQLGTIVTGKTPPTNNEGMFDGTIPFATPGDLDNWLCSTQRTVTEAGANYTKLVRAGSALVGCIGNVGKMAKTPVPTTFNQQINAIEWSDRIDDDFGISALSFEVPTMKALATSTTLPILNKSTFSSIKLIVPPISDQAKFSRLAVLVQQSLTQSQSSSSRLEKLFEVLLARAFSGQLTAQWREGHMQELLAEMSQQARVLNLPMPIELEALS